MASNKFAVFIMQVHQQSLVDHALFVDAKSGTLIESEESTVLRLSTKTLARCGGIGAVNSSIL